MKIFSNVLKSKINNSVGKLRTYYDKEKFDRVIRRLVRKSKDNFRDITIHGLKTIFRSTSIVELFFWIIVFTTGVTYCCMLLSVNVEDYNNQHVLRTIDTTAYPIFQVPFPAVTICNFNFVYKPRVKKFEDVFLQKGISQGVITDFFSSLSSLKTPENIDIAPYRKIYNILDDLGYDAMTFMSELAQPCENMLRYCMWSGVEVNCSSLFRPSKADIGLCCSFNLHVSDNLHIEEEKEYYTGSGPLLGLYVAIDVEPTKIVSSVFNLTGAYVYVHDKIEYPADSSFFSLIEPGKEVSLKISPVLTDSEEELKSFKIQSRQCLFHDEKQTFWSKQYCFQNCIQLCKLKAILNRCKCVPHYFPNVDHNNTCTLLDVPCLKRYEHVFGAISIKMLTTRIPDEENEIVCDCLPECSYVTYTGITETVYYKDLTNHLEQNNTAIRVFFQNNFCLKYKMIRYIESDAFVAVIGGLFSLCLGGSILSLIELATSTFKTFFYTFYKADEKEEINKNNYPPLYWDEILTNSKPNKIKSISYISHSNGFLKENKLFK